MTTVSGDAKAAPVPSCDNATASGSPPCPMKDTPGQPLRAQRCGEMSVTLTARITVPAAVLDPAPPTTT